MFPNPDLSAHRPHDSSVTPGETQELLSPPSRSPLTQFHHKMKMGSFTTFRENEAIESTIFTTTYFIFFCKPTVGVSLLFLKVGLKILHSD